VADSKPIQDSAHPGEYPFREKPAFAGQNPLVADEEVVAGILKLDRQALRGAPIISEIELAGRYTRARCICITGTNGKTTTTLLILC
jgi:UDP-N-acetylmuramoylalanine--D-glutamate ligase